MKGELKTGYHSLSFLIVIMTHDVQYVCLASPLASVFALDVLPGDLAGRKER